MTAKHEVTVEGRELRLSNLDKILYPKTGFSKGQVIDYYVRIAPVLLPHLAERAITLKRYPDGVAGKYFYEKQCPSHAPPWIKTAAVKKQDGTTIHYCLLNDLPSLVWAANLANLELHPFQHRASAPKRPTALVFDLDPGAPSDILACCEVAVWIRDLCASLGLKSLPKTSGSKGLQLVVPLHSATTYQQTKSLAHRIADALAEWRPDKVVADMSKSLRKGKVFIDWSQNDDSKTTVCAYSLRAMDEPVVSTPITWDELEHALARRKPGSLRFTAADVVKRMGKHGDLFAPVLTLKQKLPPLRTAAPAGKMRLPERTMACAAQRSSKG